MPAVAPRVRVVGLDHVAEQQRRTAIRMTELDRMIDPPPSLSREEPDQAEQRQGEQDGVRPIGERGVGDDEPERGESKVDQVREPDGREMRPDVDAEGGRAGSGAAEVESELRDEGRREERPVLAPIG